MYLLYLLWGFCSITEVRSLDCFILHGNYSGANRIKTSNESTFSDCISANYHCFTDFRGDQIFGSNMMDFYIHEDDFTPCKNARAITLTNNDIMDFDEKALMNLTQLTHITISNSVLLSFHLPVIYVKGLIYLDLSHNALTFIPFSYLSGCYWLTYLDLSYNYIQVVPDLRDPSYNLRTLWLEHNQIVQNGVEHIFHTRLVELIEIDLQSNNITAINLEKILLNWLKIIVIEVPNNDIESLPNPHEIANPFNVSFRLIANDNPFACNSDMVWFMQPPCSGYMDYHRSSKLESASVVIADAIEIMWNILDEMVCATPDYLRDIPVWRLDAVLITNQSCAVKAASGAIATTSYAIAGVYLEVICQAYLFLLMILMMD